MTTPTDKPDPEGILSQTVTHWIHGLRGGDEQSADELWRRYFRKLVALAEGRLPGRVRKAYDGEDVALSAFHSLCVGVRKGRFPDLDSRDELWSLLVVIAARKAQHRVRHEETAKRGGGRAPEARELAEIAGTSPTPEFAALVVDQTDHLLEILGDDGLREIARGKLEGCTNEELALASDCTVRTIERRLGLIRRIWTERGVE